MQPVRITNHKCDFTIPDLSPYPNLNCRHPGAALFAPSGLPLNLIDILSHVAWISKNKISGRGDFFWPFEGPLVKPCCDRSYAIADLGKFSGCGKTFSSHSTNYTNWTKGKGNDVSCGLWKRHATQRHRGTEKKKVFSFPLCLSASLCRMSFSSHQIKSDEPLAHISAVFIFMVICLFVAILL